MASSIASRGTCASSRPRSCALAALALALQLQVLEVAQGFGPGGGGGGSEAARYLFLDDRNVASVHNASLALGVLRKDARNPVLKEDEPWEKEINSGYPNIIFDHEEAVYVYELTSTKLNGGIGHRVHRVHWARCSSTELNRVRRGCTG